MAERPPFASERGVEILVQTGLGKVSKFGLAKTSNPTNLCGFTTQLTATFAKVVGLVRALASPERTSRPPSSRPRPPTRPPICTGFLKRPRRITKFVSDRRAAVCSTLGNLYQPRRSATSKSRDCFTTPIMSTKSAPKPPGKHGHLGRQARSPPKTPRTAPRPSSPT